MIWCPSASKDPPARSRRPRPSLSMPPEAGRFLFLIASLVKMWNRRACLNTSSRASTRLYKDIMSRYLPMASLAQESHIQWAPQVPEIREITESWVRMRHDWNGQGLVLLTFVLGIIPRAATTLFEKLDGNSRSSGSGIRAPSRISGMSMQSFAKPSTNKNWQMVATYVEVRNTTEALYNCANSARFIMSSCAIS